MKMEYDKEKDVWIGTAIEHIKKLLETHDCFCDKARAVLQGIVDNKREIKQ